MSTTLTDLVLRLESLRTKFVPGKKEYLEFLFNFNSLVVERYFPNDSLCDHLDEFRILVHGQVRDDIQRAMHNYHRHNRFYKLWVPPENRLDKLVSEYLGFYGKNKGGKNNPR